MYHTAILHCLISTIVGCCSCCNISKGICFYCLPAVLSQQGEKANEKWQDLWLACKHRACRPEKYRNTCDCTIVCILCQVGVSSYAQIVLISCMHEFTDLMKQLDWAPTINLGHESVPCVSTECYDNAVQWKRNKQRRTELEPEELESQLAMHSRTFGTLTWRIATIDIWYIVT